MKLDELLIEIRNGCQMVLQEKLTGVYVHGSIAFGCFRWEISDVDFLAVAEEPLTQTEKEALMNRLLELNRKAPPKGLEMSVVLKSACAPFAEPTPYELHFSNAHLEKYEKDFSNTCRTMNGFDPDLAAHMTVTRAVGFPLCGKPVKEVFAPVPRSSYLNSILYDIEEAEEAILHQPVYYVLNLCRVLAYAQEERVLSKEQGGRWALKKLPQEAAVIQAALNAYLQDEPMPGHLPYRAFASRMLAEIRTAANGEAEI